MQNKDLYNEDHQATYCPEDDKLRLYVGRVERDIFDALRAEGWSVCSKQREEGKGDFAAVWSIDREDTALSFAGFIGDEDIGPEERAADRAERFSGYRDNRRADAGTLADRYESGPRVHGYADAKKAEKAAARHDAGADKALDNWSKAEYWQRRTAGVISNALYKSTPAVRMGRIKRIESDLRNAETNAKEYADTANFKRQVMSAIIEHTEGKREKILAYPGWQWHAIDVKKFDGQPEDEHIYSDEQLRRCMVAAICSIRGTSDELKEAGKRAKRGEIPAAEVARAWLDHYGKEEEEPELDTRYMQHLRLRLDYERQMLAATEGGERAGELDMEPGGFIGEHQILKVNKSRQTGRVVSVAVALEWGHTFINGQRVYVDWGGKIKVERLPATAYRAPTDEEREAFTAKTNARKAKAKASKPNISLINPTDEDAERLQAILNDKANENREEWEKDKAREVVRMTQAQYKEYSKGSYSKYKTLFIGEHGPTYQRYRGNVKEGAFCKLRMTGYDPYQVVILTDKPQKTIPAEIFGTPEPAKVEAAPFDLLKAKQQEFVI